MAAGKYNFSIEQGATLLKTITLRDSTTTPINLTGAVVRGKARVEYTDPTAIITFTCVVTDAANGKFTIGLTDEQTALLDFERAYYDIEVEYAGGTVDRVLMGNVVLINEATK